MPASRETVISDCICVVLVLLAGAVRLTGYHYGTFSFNSIICGLYTSAAFIWIYQLRRRIPQPDRRWYLVLTALMIILWTVIKTVRYEFVTEEQTLSRYLWYMYYVPQSFAPMFIFYSVLYIGRPCDWRLDRMWKLLYIPAAAAASGILTNDLHQMAFRFPEGIDSWYSSDYIHGPVYFASAVWAVLMFMAILAVVIVRCEVPGNRKKVWLPAIPLAVGAAYTVGFFVRPDNFFLVMFKVPEVLCFVFAAFLECLILSHLLPSNDNYGSLWKASSIGAGLMNREGSILYKSRTSDDVTQSQVKQAETEAVMLRGGNAVLRSHQVQGGYGYWIRDISEINRLNSELEELGDILDEENAMLDAENRLMESRTCMEQQEKLYKSIAGCVKEQLDKLKMLLDDPPEDEENFEKMLKYACIFTSYVKRRSNMELAFHQNGQMSSSELQLAVSESLEYAQLYGIRTYHEFHGEQVTDGRIVIAAYEVFEAVLETGLPSADAMMVDVKISDNMLNMHIEVNNPAEIVRQDYIREKINPNHGSFEVETENITEYITLILPTGGEYL